MWLCQSLREGWCTGARYARELHCACKLSITIITATVVVAIIITMKTSITTTKQASLLSPDDNGVINSGSNRTSLLLYT